MDTRVKRERKERDTIQTRDMASMEVIDQIMAQISTGRGFLLCFFFVYSQDNTNGWIQDG